MELGIFFPTWLSMDDKYIMFYCFNSMWDHGWSFFIGKPCSPLPPALQMDSPKLMEEKVTCFYWQHAHLVDPIEQFLNFKQVTLPWFLHNCYHSEYILKFEQSSFPLLYPFDRWHVHYMSIPWCGINSGLFAMDLMPLNHSTNVLCTPTMFMTEGLTCIILILFQPFSALEVICVSIAGLAVSSRAGTL